MEGGLINPLALIRTGAEEGVTSEQQRIEEDISPPARADLNKKPRPEGRG